MTIGSRIKLAREDANMSQEQLGKLCGTTKQTIFKYENGIVTNIPLDRLTKMADVLSISPAYLMGWENDLNNGALLDGNTKKEVATVTDSDLSGLDRELISMLCQLSPDDCRRVKDFVAGLKSARTK